MASNATQKADASTTPVRFYGIRHHGPGSARSLALALEHDAPDCLLIEGPPDAATVLPLLGDPEIRFPVALLIYVPDDPKRAVYYPFAKFSPETVAIRFALERGIPVQFMDLPMSHALARIEPDLKAEAATSTSETSGEETPTPDASSSIEMPDADISATMRTPRADPLQWLARAAGYEDSERWWEDLVEHRRDETGIFEAVSEAMTALRIEMDAVGRLEGMEETEQSQREAWMRNTIRGAARQGYRNIAVVCGAWHVPALSESLQPSFSARDDAATLKNLPKTRVEATWVPWTNDRLCFASGYGAGIESPGWYEHLWKCRTLSPDEIAPRWMARVAALMRQEDLDTSSAHLIEAVRLAQTLASLRGRPFAGLTELNEATRCVLGFGDDIALKLVSRKLIVGEKMGAVPESAPTIPLQQDLAREQRRLRFAPEATQKILDLDLRKPGDLDRSRLLHRLRLLGIAWGALERGRGGKGTFHEIWRVEWAPEFAIRVIQAGIWGNSVESAATAKAIDQAAQTNELPLLSALLDAVLLADLPGATDLVTKRLENVAATSTDAAHLMDALPPLARIYRYGDVRGTSIASVEPILRGIGARLWINLPLACKAQNDEAAHEYLPRLDSVAAALALWNDQEATRGWQGALRQISESAAMPGLLAGRAARLLFDGGVLEGDEAATLVSLSLSGAGEPARAASWVEGFLGHSGLLLLHDERLWNVIDEWLCGLSTEAFTPVLPLLRRTWSQFPPAERRAMGERVQRPRGAMDEGAGKDAAAQSNFDWERAQLVLPVLGQLLGVNPRGDQASRGA